MSAFVLNSYRFGGEDADAKAYLDAVEAADAQALEAGVRKAVDDFVRGCKADSIWSAIKTACFLAGPRTVAGGLVDLVTATTIATNYNNNFVSGDIDRETGWKGNASNKLIRTGVNASDTNYLSQNNHHIYVNCTEQNGNTTTSSIWMGTVHAQTGSLVIRRSGTSPMGWYSMSSTVDAVVGQTNINNGNGISRSESGSYTRMNEGATGTVTRTSQTPRNEEIGVFNNGAATTSSNSARIAFYSIGTSVNLALLDTRVETYLTDLAAAI